MKNKNVLTGLLVFMTLLLGTVYLSIFSAKEEKKVIEKIEIIGNHFLNTQEYFKFTCLNNVSDYRYLNLSIIKDRIEKHPYVLKADVKFAGGNKVQVNITEKNFQAHLLTDTDEYLLGDDFVLIPVFPYTRNSNVPVIKNSLLPAKLKSFDVLRTSEIVSAFRIIEAAKHIDPEIYSSLSDIDMGKGKDIVLYFTGFNFRVTLGRGNEVRKLLEFEKVWKMMTANKQAAENFINYIDLRYSNLIYIDVADSSSEVKGI